MSLSFLGAPRLSMIPEAKGVEMGGDEEDEFDEDDYDEDEELEEDYGDEDEEIDEVLAGSSSASAVRQQQQTHASMGDEDDEEEDDDDSLLDEDEADEDVEDEEMEDEDDDEDEGEETNPLEDSRGGRSSGGTGEGSDSPVILLERGGGEDSCSNSAEAIAEAVKAKPVVRLIKVMSKRIQQKRLTFVLSEKRQASFYSSCHFNKVLPASFVANLRYFTQQIKK